MRTRLPWLFFSSRRRHTRWTGDWSSDVCSSDLVSENGLDDPDQQFYENFVCGADRNYGGYCNPELDRLIDRQSVEQIGRASCRERVEVTVLAAPLEAHQGGRARYGPLGSRTRSS